MKKRGHRLLGHSELHNAGKVGATVIMMIVLMKALGNCGRSGRGRLLLLLDFGSDGSISGICGRAVGRRQRG
eukprot:4290607-Amphidinium_carterae.1